MVIQHTAGSEGPATAASGTLLDVQGLPDIRGIDLKRVGVSRVDIPMQILQADGHYQTVTAKATMSVGLPKEHKGTHMSRFIIQLSEWSRGKVISMHLPEFMAEAQERLNATTAQLDLTFQYFVEKPAPVTRQSAPMGFVCRLQGRIDQDVFTMGLGVTVPIATLCPCSKAISKYGAHNQRAEVAANLVVASEEATNQPVIWFEDIITLLEETASCPVYPLLKREDEKYVTERQYENAKFVEDVIRDATHSLRKLPSVAGFSLEVEALESIHGHNAWTYHEEGRQLPRF